MCISTKKLTMYIRNKGSRDTLWYLLLRLVDKRLFWLGSVDWTVFDWHKGGIKWNGRALISRYGLQIARNGWLRISSCHATNNWWHRLQDLVKLSPFLFAREKVLNSCWQHEQNFNKIIFIWKYLIKVMKIIFHF